MKEICGYRSLNGRFYEDKGDCEKADAVFKINSIQNKLNNFEERVTLHLDEKLRKSCRYLEGSYGYEIMDFWTTNKPIILGAVAEQVLKNHDTFLEVLKEKEDLKSELDLLKKDYDKEHVEREKIMKEKTKPHQKTKWWLNIKWW